MKSSLHYNQRIISRYWFSSSLIIYHYYYLLINSYLKHKTIRNQCSIILLILESCHFASCSMAAINLYRGTFYWRLRNIAKSWSSSMSFYIQRAISKPMPCILQWTLMRESKISMHHHSSWWKSYYILREIISNITLHFFTACINQTDKSKYQVTLTTIDACHAWQP